MAQRYINHVRRGMLIDMRQWHVRILETLTTVANQQELN
jgi:hypothetical protein